MFRLQVIAVTALLLALLLGGVGVGVAIGRWTAPPARTSVSVALPVPNTNPVVDGGLGQPEADAGAAATEVIATLDLDVLTAAGQPAAGALVKGVLIDQSGHPLVAPRPVTPAGELGVMPGAPPRLADVLRGADGGAASSAGITTTTDRQGAAQLRVLLSAAQPARLLLIASADPDLSASTEVLLLPIAAPPAYRLVLRLAGAPAAALATEVPEAPEAMLPADQTPAARVPLRGVVLDERGRPLSGTSIDVGEGGRTLSDARGQFSLGGVPRTRQLVRARHAGFVPLTYALAPDDPALRDGRALELQLSPGGGLEGEVREQRLGGVPARVQLVWQVGEARMPIPVGRDGRFRVTGLPPGEGMLVVQAPGYAPLRQALQLAPAEHLDQITARDLRLELEPR